MTGPGRVRLFEQEWPDGEYRFFQMGYVVRDLIAAARNWARVMGVGPFHVMPRTQGPCLYRGDPADMDIQVAVAQAGPMQVELIQVFSPRGVFTEQTSLDSTEQAIHQLCTVTEDFDAKKRHFVDLGYEVACEMTDPRYRVAYLDTYADFGFYVEIVENKPSFQANLARIAQRCATWDGVTDPVRLLTRRGYTTPESAVEVVD